MAEKNSVYESWFDSKYYHLLYKNRDDSEAHVFIDNLIRLLNPKPYFNIWDMACGRGRHCIYLNKKGFNVTGTDLSPSNIEFAKSFENKSLTFEIHDMRESYKENAFDLVLNLFTSFGYFEKEKDKLNVFKNVFSALKSDGIFIMDFMNVKQVLNTLVKKEIKSIEGITFNISRRLENNFIIKTISFTDNGKQLTFNEQVEALYLEDFKRYFKHNGLKLINLFGDYNLKDFDQNYSERLIMVCNKL